MPRGARLDAPGTLHHVIVRGIERSNIVVDDKDRENWVERMGLHAESTGAVIYAWALLENHAHILVRSGLGGLPALMRRLLTGYAVSFNRQHRRFGHLFQKLKRGRGRGAVRNWLGAGWCVPWAAGQR